MAEPGIVKAFEAAKSLRQRWKAGSRPACNLFRLAGDQGVLVFRLALDGKLSGALVRSRRHGIAVIAVNVSKPQYHQVFTLAHELGHLELHALDGVVEAVNESDEGQAEKEANVFAAEFLVPLSELKRVLVRYGISAADVSDQMVIDLARKFGVSHATMLWRLRIIGDLSPAQVKKRICGVDWRALWQSYAPEDFANVMEAAEQPAWRPEGLSKATLRQIAKLPDVYRDMAFEACRKDLVTANKLAEILGLSREQISNELWPILKPHAANQAENGHV